MTSFQALGSIKRALGHGKVGHTGTLDKFATGLMIVLVGKLTRLASLVEGLDKTYEGVVAIGTETSTLDPEGSVVDEKPIPEKSQWEVTKPQFQGPILQSPPAYSAIHMDGKRAYERVLAGEVVEMKPRPVTIHELKIISIQEDSLEIFVHCSKGTYIRSLARDWAKATSTCGYLKALKRLSIGKIDLTLAVSPEKFNPETDLHNVKDFLPLWSIDSDSILPEALPLLLQGKLLQPDWFLGGLKSKSNKLGIFDQEGQMRALLEKNEQVWTYGFVGV